LELLRRVPFLSPLPESTLEQLAKAAVALPMRAGDEVVRQGEPGDRFYLIESGSADVFVDGVRVGNLSPGEFLGEIALLRNVPRTATVRAREDGALLALSRDAFVPAVAGYAPSRSSADAVIGLRLGPARASHVAP